jgi:hypothetical protein
VGAMLLGLGVALACSGSVDEGDKDPGDAAADQGPGGSGGVYGPPPPEDAGEDALVAEAAYGPPPPTGGSGGVYGPPPPVDAGEDVVFPDAAYGPPPPLDGGEEDAEQDAPDEAMSGAYGPPPDSGS